MPTTKKESLYFGLIMCFGMVLFMTIYNLYLNGMIGELPFIEGLFDFMIGFAIALALDIFIVGPNAKRIALKLTKNTNSPIFTVLAISTCMVLGMAFFMSIYGLGSTYLHTDHASNSVILDYLAIYGKNLIVALSLQILVMGPIVRYIFITFIKEQDASTEIT